MNFLLAGGKFMPGMHLRHPEFTHSNYELFTKNKEKYKNLQKREIQDISIKTNQIKSVFSML